MKRTYLLIATLFLSALSFAQAPHTFSYQTIRDVNWNVIPDQDISI